ncbi:hypothetical protein EVAR_3824_1, partial [Eumeta japonica]
NTSASENGRCAETAPTATRDECYTACLSTRLLRPFKSAGLRIFSIS